MTERMPGELSFVSILSKNDWIPLQSSGFNFYFVPFLLASNRYTTEKKKAKSFTGSNLFGLDYKIPDNIYR